MGPIYRLLGLSLGVLQHDATAACVRAERAVSLALGGSCTIPLGAFATLEGARLRLTALVAAPDGTRAARVECAGPVAEPESLGARAAAELRARGAEAILAALG
jgi:hydroxymethylbilane synthase